MENIDVFDEFFTDLLYVMSNDDYAILFRNMPAEQQDQVLARLNLALRRHQLRQAIGNRSRTHEYFYFIWLLNVIPLPVVKYRRLWHDFYPRIGEMVSRFLAMTVILAMKFVRITLFLVGSSLYLQRIFRTLFTFSNELTFSNNFFKDVITYLLRNNQGIFDRVANVNQHGLANLIAPENVTSWQFIKELFLHFVMLHVNFTCIKYNEEPEKCSPDTNLLIFKFHDIVKSIRPNSNPTLWMVTIYLLYALLGNFICMNILYMCSINLGNRLKKYGSYFTNFINILWKGLKNLM